MSFPLEIRQHYKANKMNLLKRLTFKQMYIDGFYWNRGKQFAVHELPG